MVDILRIRTKGLNELKVYIDKTHIQDEKKMNLKNFRKTIDDKKAVLESVNVRLEGAEDSLGSLNRDLKFSEQALTILQIVAKQTQEQLEYRISELVSLALESVFDDPYKMRLIYETKRNKTEAKLSFERNGEQLNPLSSTGGGAVDVAAFALRVALWNLADPKTDNVLVLDEPFKHLSKGLLPRAGLMLKEISEKLNLQIIMVTHLDELKDDADKVFQVSIKNGISKVEGLL